MEIIEIFVLESSCKDIEKDMNDMIIVLLKTIKKHYDVLKMKSFKERRHNLLENRNSKNKKGIFFQLSSLRKSLRSI
jgi:hypothetical protein